MGGAAPSLDWCPFETRTEYVEKISAFLRDHPFRAEERCASPVFAAYVGSVVFGDVRVQKALGDVGRSTGLLFDFVTHGEPDRNRDLDEWQFAALHLSMLAAEWQDVTAEVAVAHEESVSRVYELAAELYLAEGPGARGLRFTLSLDTPDELRLHGPTAFLSVSFPGATVVVDAHNGSATLGPDTYILCSRLQVRGEAVEVARRSPGTNVADNASDASVVSRSTPTASCQASSSATCRKMSLS